MEPIIIMSLDFEEKGYSALSEIRSLISSDFPGEEITEIICSPTTVVICALKWIKKRKEDEQEFLEILGKINEETIKY